MAQQGSQRLGFTLVEVLFTTALSLVVITVAVAGFIYALRGERLNAVQNKLDVDVRVAMGWLKHDLRLSSMDYIILYPQGPGPYTAISFPMAKDNDGDGAIELDANGQIIWDRTVIYHVWSNAPSQLRVTTFEPRNNTLTPAQRQEQLASVVLYGNGSRTFESNNAQTRVLFQNLFRWSISGRAGRYDGYAPTASRDIGADLGSIILTNGPHNYKFTIVGRNPASSGFRMGLDTVVGTYSGLEREAENQSVIVQSGASAYSEYMPGGSWSGNHRLVFPATATGQYCTLQMNTDQWEEQNFRATGTKCEGTRVEFDETLSPRDYVVRLNGYGYAWYVDEQTRDLTGEGMTDDRMSGYAVRVLLRGSEMTDGNWIKLEGGKTWIAFAGPRSNCWLSIDGAYIAECASSTNISMDAVPGTMTPLLFSGYQAASKITWWTWAGPANFDIDRTKSYLVSFLVSRIGMQANPWRWTDTTNRTVNSFLIPGSSSPTLADLANPTWSTRSDVIRTNAVFGVQWMYVYYKTNGYYTSQIVDTKLEAPGYTEITWNADKPSGTVLNMKVRTGNAPDMSDAPAWTNIAWFSSPRSISPGNRRYVQFMTQMQPNAGAYYTPKLKDVTIKWRTDTRVADIGGIFSKGPDHGIFEVTVDGRPLVKGISVDLEIYANVRSAGGTNSTLLTSALTTEIEPRNTGK